MPSIKLKEVIEVQTLLNQGKESIYEAVKKANHYSKLNKFKKEVTALGSTIFEIWNGVFDSIGLSWGTLNSVLKSYPKKNQWRDGNLNEMIRLATMKELKGGFTKSKNQKKGTQSTIKIKKRTASIYQFDTVVQESKDKDAKIAILEAEIALLKSEKRNLEIQLEHANDQLAAHRRDRKAKKGKVSV